MSRKGRKRKSGQRKPSGDLSRPERGESPNVVALRQPHRRWAPAGFEHDQRAETPLGMLAMIGAVPEREYNAARRYARVVKRYQQLISAPNAAPPSIAGAFEPKHGSSNASDAERGEFEYRRIRDALSEHRKTPKGRTALAALYVMAVDDKTCPVGAFKPMMEVLSTLVAHFEGLDTPARNAVRRGK